MVPVTSLFAPVESDLQVLVENLKNLVGAKHPILYAAAEHLFGAGGKPMNDVTMKAVTDVIDKLFM